MPLARNSLDDTLSVPLIPSKSSMQNRKINRVKKGRRNKTGHVIYKDKTLSCKTDRSVSNCNCFATHISSVDILWIEVSPLTSSGPRMTSILFNRAKLLSWIWNIFFINTMLTKNTNIKHLTRVSHRRILTLTTSSHLIDFQQSVFLRRCISICHQLT